MLIRPEKPKDRAAIARIHRSAFGGPDEAELVERLRKAGGIAISLVAEENRRPVGHILLSWLFAEIDGRSIKALALAPLAVEPDRQRQGIGSQLVEASIPAARDVDADIIAVVGHPGFYRRFGFSSQKAALLDNPFNINAFMALELVPGILERGHGSVTYPAAFGLKPKESPQI